MMAGMSPPPLPHLEEAEQGLERFGLSGFRPGQAEVVSAVMSGRNAVVVMPTGAGKSLCYQLPATLLPGVTLVVSPLIALMKDQVEQLEARGIPATCINSTLTDPERMERLRKLREGAYKLVYVAPERFRSPSFLDAVAEAGVSLFAIDEAHCISQWGHDFRPDYALLGKVRKRLRPPRTVALTATATPEVVDDVVKSLLMKDPRVFVAGFDRPNLFLEVAAAGGDEDKRQGCEQLIEEGGAGIIYCSTRKSAESLFRALRKKGRPLVLYHAGMDDDARHRAQDEFMANPNGVAVATNAFGMGIDKSDIRFVVHANIPKAVEAYYQEIGRAGRDGKDSRAVLLFNHSDVFTQERLIQGAHPSEAAFRDLWRVLLEAGEFDKGVNVLAAQAGSSEFELSAALRILEREGKVTRGGRGEGLYGLLLQEKAREAHPTSKDAQVLLSALLDGFAVGRWGSSELSALCRRTGLGPDELRHALGLLEKSGALQVRRPFSGRTIRVLEQRPFDELGLDLSGVREQERRSLLLLKRMTDYAYARKCRRAFLVRYFGEAGELPKNCGNCDVCIGARITVKPTARSAVQASPFAPGAHSELAVTELRRFRRELARDLDVPPFIIFNDATLIALATALPIDRESFLEVKGTGETRWERFGPKVVEICLVARAAGHQPSVPAAGPSKARRRE